VLFFANQQQKACQNKPNGKKRSLPRFKQKSYFITFQKIFREILKKSGTKITTQLHNSHESGKFEMYALLVTIYTDLTYPC
jgi:hypothetical protein